VIVRWTRVILSVIIRWWMVQINAWMCVELILCQVCLSELNAGLLATGSHRCGKPRIRVWGVQRPFLLPSPAKHIRALLVRWSAEGNEASIPEPALGADKSIAFSEHFFAKFKLG
jgi:hypothetical protein